MRALLEAPRHVVVRLVSRLPPPLGAIDHELLATALLLRALGERSKDLAAGLGPDAILYRVGERR